MTHATATLLSVILCVVSTGLLPAQTPAQPNFVDGDLSKLACKVVDVEVITRPMMLVTIECVNRGNVGAEPLAFELRFKDRKNKTDELRKVVRARLPHVARFGNPTPAGGKRRYLVRTHLPSKKTRVTATATATAATFYDGGVATRPDLRIEKPEQVQRSSLIGTFGVTQVALTNPFDRDVEVLLRARFTQPRNCTDLVGVRLAAKERLEWVIPTHPDQTPYLDSDYPPGHAVKVTEFEVVDWCLVGRSDPVHAARLLRAPFEAWYRWPGEDLTVNGKFSYRGKQKRINSPGQYDDFACTGTFTTTSAGSPRVALDEGTDGGAGHLVAVAFADVLRGDFDRLVRDNRLVLITPDRVALIGPGWDTARRQTQSIATSRNDDRPELARGLEVTAGRISAATIAGEPTDRWEHRRFGDHYVVWRRTTSSTETTWSYRERNGLVVPAVVRHTTAFGDDLFAAEVITFSDVQIGGTAKVQPIAPQGEGADTLRTIWDGAFSLVRDPVEITADFAVEAAATELLWQGVTRLRGSVKLRGIGPHLRHADFTFRTKLTADKELALAAAINDRFLIWHGRDFNCRQPFDVAFDGATIAKANPAGDYVVIDHRIAKVRTKDGVVTGFELRGGGTRTFRHGKCGKQRVVTRITETFGDRNSKSRDRWTATTDVKWQQVGDHILPTAFVFTRIFGKDWGPEKITLTRLKAK